MMMRKLVPFALAVASAMSATAVLAQQYPVKPVRVIVPYGPGTTSDIIGRTISDRLTLAFGQPFLVENRTGAGGSIGYEFAAKAPPDGYTLAISTAATPILASVYRDLKYDTGKDFASVTVFTHSPLGLAANLNFPAKTIPELIAYVKANPGKVSFGSLGVGTSHHLTGEMLKLQAGLDMIHVPYRGSGPAHVDLMGGQIQLMFDNLVALLPHFRAGKLRPIAVSSKDRHPLLPDVPSLSEGGVKDFEAIAWFGMLAPAGTPREVINRLNTEVLKVLQIPEVRQRLIDGGSRVIGNSPEEADRFLRSEIDRWGRVVRGANVRQD